MRAMGIDIGTKWVKKKIQSGIKWIEDKIEAGYNAIKNTDNNTISIAAFQPHPGPEKKNSKKLIITI